MDNFPGKDPKMQSTQPKVGSEAEFLPEKEDLDHPVEVIDFAPIREQALAKYKQARPSVADWDEETTSRMSISTRYEWGKMIVSEGDKKDVYMFNKVGEGPDSPLKGRTVARVSLFASLPTFTHSDGQIVKGFVEKTPFTVLCIDKKTALQLRSSKTLSLEKFLAQRSGELALGVVAKRNFLAKQLQAARKRSKARRAGKTEVVNVSAKAAASNKASKQSL